MDDKASAGKQESIVATLRDDIVRRVVEPGERLPSNKDLQVRFGVTSLTISRATKRLIDDGYLFSRERSGVFVAEYPPHLYRFGLIFHSHPSTAGEWPGMYDVFYREALAMSVAGPTRFEVFHHIHGHRPGVDWTRLVEATAAHRLGGLIFASDPWQLAGAPFMGQRDLPRIAVMQPRPESGISSVTFKGFTSRSMARLRELGCRRVALLESSALVKQRALTHSELLPEAGGMEFPPHMHLYSDIHHPDCARSLVHLLLTLPPGERPDALVISDDNLVPAAELGILDAGLRVPDDLQVIAHCNFPNPPPRRLPLEWLGYDLRACLLGCVDLLRDIRLTGSGPTVLEQSAVFESEPLAKA